MVSFGGESSRVLEKGTQHESVRAVEDSKKGKQEKETLFVWLPNDTFWIRLLLRNCDKVSHTHSSPDHADSLDRQFFPFHLFLLFPPRKEEKHHSGHVLQAVHLPPSSQDTPRTPSPTQCPITTHLHPPGPTEHRYHRTWSNRFYFWLCFWFWIGAFSKRKREEA